MAKPTYDKPPVTISEQLDVLDEKGMTIADMAFARHALETIGYYRFTGYAYTFRDQADNSSYLEGTTFQKKPRIFIFGDRNRRRDNGKLYFMVCVIKKLLQPIIPNDTLESDLTSLFAKYPFADKRKNTYLGFPDDWNNDKGVWQ